MMDHVLNIIKDTELTYNQKVVALAREAENSQQVLNLTGQEKSYLKEGIICDLAEGNAPYRPRYNLVDFKGFMERGSQFLALTPPENLWEAVNNLLILYKHIPSVTTFPVYLGNIDKLLDPYIKSEDEAYRLIKLFLTHIDRTLTDAFVHANIGPEATTAGRLILKAERELENPVPNLTLKYDPAITSDDFSLEAVKTGLEVSKPYFANHNMFCRDFGKEYGIASCYNGLPIGGGSFTLVRLNLKALAEKSADETRFMEEVLPQAVGVMASIMDKRIRFIVEESGFFRSNFLVEEGFLKPDRYTAMFGVYGLAEAVNHLLQAEEKDRRYGRNNSANEFGLRIIKKIKEEVEKHHNQYCEGTDQRFLLHAQSGIDTDVGTTPGCRIPIGDEPELYEHLIQAGIFQPFFPSGISDIFAFDSTYKRNPAAVLDIARGAMKNGLRLFTFYTSDSELVRITGYLVKRSEMEKVKDGRPVLRDTTILGLKTDESRNLKDRKVR